MHAKKEEGRNEVAEVEGDWFGIKDRVARAVGSDDVWGARDNPANMDSWAVPQSKSVDDPEVDCNIEIRRQRILC